MKKKYLTLLLPISALLLSSCTNNPQENSPKPTYIEIDEDYEEPEIPASSDVVINVNDVDLDKFETHTEQQYAYINSGYNKVNSFASGKQELSKPREIEIVVGDSKQEKNLFYIEISENKDFKQSKIYNEDKNYISLTNLKINTEYFYRGADSSSALKTAKTYSFKTADTKIRNISINGVTNVRDIGGYSSKLGGTVRQGLYYRGGRFNVTDEKTTIDQTSTYKQDITEEGYITAVEELGIKSEIDLRMNESHYVTTYAHEYGMITNETFPDIEYYPYPLNWTVSNMMKQEKETIGNIFKLLAKPEVYPVYCHCNIGTDRTGMCTYLLGTLLGINQEDLYRDYLFSNFGNINNSRDISKVINVYQKTLLEYKNYNLYQDVRSYLNECGVSDEELDSIVSIFLDLEVKGA